MMRRHESKVNPPARFCKDREFSFFAPNLNRNLNLPRENQWVLGLAPAGKLAYHNQVSNQCSFQALCRRLGEGSPAGAPKDD
jgi:hypothetical protein